MKRRILNFILLNILLVCGASSQKEITHNEVIADTNQLFTTDVVVLKTINITADPHLKERIIAGVDSRIRSIQTSQDLLRMVPGLFLAQHAGGGKAEQIFLRGFDIDHGTDIAISTDGIPVNMVSHAHGQGYADLHYLIPETVDRIHFGKGPYHTHKGNMATAGYVGFQTKNTLEENLLSFQVGQFNSYRTLGLINLLDYKKENVSRNAYLAGEIYSSDGYFESSQDLKRYSLFGKFSGSIGRNNFISLTGSTFSSRWDASGQIPQRAVDSGAIGYFGSIDDTEGGQTSRVNINTQLMTSLNDGSWVKNQVYYTKYDFDLYSNFTFYLNDQVYGDQIRQKEERNMVGYSGSFHREDKLMGTMLESEFGIQMRFDLSSDNELSHTFEKTLLIDRLAFGDINESNVAAFLIETIRLSPLLTVATGIRFDHFRFSYKDHLTGSEYKTISENIWSPKVNAFFKVTDNLQVNANAGYGFHTNDSRVVVAQNGDKSIPRALGIDIGLLWKAGGRILLNPSLWSLNFDQEFVYVGDEAIIELSGPTRRMGVELSGRWQVTDWLFADIDLNYTMARTMNSYPGENYIPLAPKFSSIGGLTVLNQRWKGSVRYRSLGNRPANAENSVIAEGYDVVDAVVTYRINKFELGLNIDNLFDVKWKEAQFETESRLKDELEPVSEIHFSPGSPLNLRVHAAYIF